MKSCGSYKIDLRTLKSDRSVYRYTLDNDYFEALDEAEIKKGQLEAQLTIKQSAGAFLLNFEIEGVVTLTCDRCLGEMEQPISTSGDLCVKLGDETEDDGDVIVVSERDGVIDVAWYMYEFIALDIPIQHMHADGECDEQMLEILSEHKASEQPASDVQETKESPWDVLKNIINN